MYWLRYLFLLILLTSCLSSTKGQKNYVQAEPESLVLTKVPFTMLTGGVIIVKAVICGYPDSLNFILDTGSGGISLDSATVKRMGLKTTPSAVRVRGVAGIKKVPFIYNQSLGFSSLRVDSLQFHVNDYEFLSQEYGVLVNGVIGFSLFKRYIIRLDYDHYQMEICSQGHIKYPRGGYLLKPFISTLPVHKARIKDQQTRHALFLHDIGAGVGIMLSEDFVRDSAFFKKKRKFWPKEGMGIGGVVEMRLTVSSKVKIGRYRFRNVPTTIFKDTYNVTSYPYLSGLIGNDIFRRFNMIYNYQKREIHLKPNLSFKDPFDYAYSGTKVIWINNQIIIGYVAEDSPASWAGLKTGDVVLAINNRFDNDLQSYKKELQKPNSKAKLIIRRGTDILEIVLKIGSIK